MKRIVSILFAGLLLIVAASARADIFVLASGGQVRGEMVVSPDVPKDRWVIRTASGGEVTVEKNQITKIDPQSAAELEYEKIRPTYADTVDGQWKLAVWCLEHSLLKQRQTHLERIIVLDPDHKKARGALGYSFIDGRWIQPDDLMKERGYVRYKNTWKLPQEVELAEQKRKQEAAERAWFTKVKSWRTAIDARPDRAQQLTDDLFAKADSAAVPAVQRMLTNESVRKVKIMLIDELVRLGTPEALRTVITCTLDDLDEEVRLSALDSLGATKHPELAANYVKALKDRDNTRVNRAAYCLGKLGEKSAVSPLIGALRTKHTYTEPGANPGQTTTTFGSGPGMSSGGMSVGGGSKEVHLWIENQEVLRALVALTGENFEFDQRAWKSWYASQRKPVTLDARRGE
jgi:hypothetical protein